MGDLCGTSTSAQDARLQRTGRLDGLDFELSIADSAVLDAARRFPTPRAAVEAMLTIGAYAALATSTGFDAQAVRREIDRAVQDATAAVDALRDHVVETVSEQGPFALALEKATDELGVVLRETLDRQGDPDDPASFLTKLRVVVKQVDELLASTRRTIAGDLARTAKEQSDNVGRALKDMRDLEPSSALGRAMAQLETRMIELTSAVAANQRVAGERLSGTAKGADYEDRVAYELGAIAAVYGDRAEQTGAQGGRLISKKGASLRGDVSCWIDGDIGLVVEAMDRDKSKLTDKLVRAELLEAMENRSAVVAIAVMSSVEGTLMCGQPLQVLAPNMWAVQLGHDGSNLIPLQVTYRLAREAAMAEAMEPATLDMEALKSGIEDVNRKLTALAEVRQQIDNIASCQEKASAGLVRFEREMRESIFRLLNSVATQIIQDAARGAHYRAPSSR